MSREHIDDGPQGFHNEGTLLDHTVLLANAIHASTPARRTSKPFSARSVRAWLARLRNIGAALDRPRQPERRTVVKVDHNARVTIDAWAMRATGASGFGGAEAANDASYSSAA